MSLKTQLQNAVDAFTKATNHPALKTDGRYSGVFYHAAQDFVIAAENAGVTQNNVASERGLDIDGLVKKLDAVNLFSEVPVYVDENYTLAVQNVVDHLKAREITSTNNPHLNAVKNQLQVTVRIPAGPAWGPRT